MAGAVAAPRARGTALREKMVALYQEGRSFQEVAEIVGMSPAAVRYQLRLAGLIARDRLQALRAAGSRISRGLKGRPSPNYKGGRIRHGGGYILVYVPDHPCADQYGYVFEHRLVAQETLGRFLHYGEVVHHRNGIRDDNRPSNLEVIPRSGAHTALHNHMRKESGGYARRASARR